MSKLFSVVKEILKKYDKMTTMKLQKLVYYCQAWNLAWDEKPIFEEDFQAWSPGPVCPELYEHHKGKFETSLSDFEHIDSPELDKDEDETIEKVLEFYGDKNSHWLSELTCMEEPWKNARGNISAGVCENIITKKDMAFYYKSL